MLHPREVGIARRRHPVLPALVVAEELAAPVTVVEEGIREDVVGLEIGMAVVVKRVLAQDLTLDSADREVHAR